MKINSNFKMAKLIRMQIIILLIFKLVLNAQNNLTNNILGNVNHIESFLDSITVEKLEQNNITGCGIVIVKDTSIIFSKGYGYADRKNNIPFSNKSTLFRLASVSKVVTGTVILKLREEGKFDFKTDINKYLKKFKIKEYFGEPITFADLLTHTGGFDDSYIGKSSRTKEDAPPFGDFVRDFLPERVVPPGEIYSYSNMGIALAAFVAEEITGRDYEAYAREKLFNPLEMNMSSFTLQPFQIEKLSKGYVKVNEKKFEFPFDHLNDFPAGQMLTTLNEFGNFMILHINKGKFKNKQILLPETITEMQTTQFTHHPKLHGSMGYTWGIGEEFGTKVLGHSGGYPGIDTRLWLFPKLNFGMFIVSNTPSPGFVYEIFYSFMNKFYRYREPESEIEYPLTDLPEYDKDVERFTGFYRPTRYSRNSITKTGVLTGMLGNEMPVWQNDDGMILMFDHNGKERRLIQIEPLLFQSIDDKYYMAFREDGSKNITHIFTSGTSALEKVPWHYTINFQQNLFFIVNSLFLLTVIIGLILLFKGSKTTKNSLLLKMSITTSASFILYLLVFSLIIFFILSPIERNIGFAYGMPWYIYFVQIIPFIAVAFLIGFIITLYKELTSRRLSLISMILSFLFISVCAINIWFMLYWKILGFNF